MTQQNPTGHEWQARINKLCTIQCTLTGEVYQPIPDQTDGDGGLEGITTAGYGYQCFADQESVSASDITRKQLGKIADDLAKLFDRRVYWEKYFADKKQTLRRWFLVCPVIKDKKVLPHAKKHAKLLRDKKLPYIDKNFQAFVVEEYHFELALQHEKALAAQKIDLPTDEPASATIGAFAKKQSEFVAKIDRKLKLAMPSLPSDRLIERRKEYLSNYLKFQNALRVLFVKEPSLHVRIDAFLEQKRSAVKFESDLSDRGPSDRLVNLKEALAKHMTDDFKLTHASVDALSLGAIAGWLGLCHLHFGDGVK